MGKALEGLAFINETSLNTKLVKTTGGAPIGARLCDHAPFSHWHTQTSIAMTENQGPWLKFDDEIPRYERFGPDDAFEDPGL